VKILTLLGTRPEIIRLSLVIEKLDRHCEHVLVHTGQNYDSELSEVFFEELGVRAPDRMLGVQAPTFGRQIGGILAAVEEVLEEVQPDRFLVLGDTNSGLGAIVAKRMGIRVFHMEAGNRCYDDRVPEEVNRRLIDHSSDVLMPYTERSRANLIREGVPGERIHVIGNPIFEVLNRHEAAVAKAGILDELNLEERGYFLVTLHREENVDVEQRLRSFIGVLELLHAEYGLPIVCSLHPRTRKMMERHGLHPRREGFVFARPFGLFDFVALERSALCVLSDSGTVQEECCIFRVPNVTLRDVTERPETIEGGSNILSGADPEAVVRSVRVALAESTRWRIPPEYTVEDVSGTATKIVLGQHRFA
jgi:UDP-N-acetylglucosamine 2-epimerase (non-hydrolysing)